MLATAFGAKTARFEGSGACWLENGDSHHGGICIQVDFVDNVFVGGFDFLAQGLEGPHQGRTEAVVGCGHSVGISDRCAVEISDRRFEDIDVAVSNPYWETPSHGVFEDCRAIESRNVSSFSVADPSSSFRRVFWFW